MTNCQKYNNTDIIKILSFLSLCVCVFSVVSTSLQPHGLWPARLLSPWDFPGRNTGVGCHFLLQGTFPVQGLNRCLLCLLHGGRFYTAAAPCISTD